jgi:ABC-type Na+ transport system ATPase subunit NatA
VVLVGILGIVLGAQGSRGTTHVVLLSVVLAENTLALLARGRHPVLAFAAVLATYALVNNEATTLLPVLLALFTVATARDRRTIRLAAGMTALVVIARSVIGHDSAGLFIGTLLPLLGIGLAAAAGINHRTPSPA